MFDLLLALVLFIPALLGGVLGRIVLSHANTTYTLNARRIAVIGIGMGIIGGISTAIARSAAVALSGEALTVMRLAVAFVGGSMSVAIGGTIGFVVIGNVIGRK